MTFDEDPVNTPTDPLSNWPRGYRAALDDVKRLAPTYGINNPALAQLLTELRHDSDVIMHQLKSRKPPSSRPQEPKPQKAPVDLSEI